MNNSKRIALVLLSGGLDSTTCATLASQEFGPENVIALNFRYGQIHFKEELAGEAVAKYLNLREFRTEKVPSHYFKGTKCSLVGEAEVPEGPYPETLGPLNTYVPFRNGTLLSIATAIAQSYEASAIYFGAHAEDAQNSAYPDCTPEFIDAMATAIHMGTYGKTKLITPLKHLVKWEVVRLGMMIDAPLHLSWSCYKGLEEPCLTCPTCISRAQAFLSNGISESDYIELCTRDDKGVF